MGKPFGSVWKAVLVCSTDFVHLRQSCRRRSGLRFWHYVEPDNKHLHLDPTIDIYSYKEETASIDVALGWLGLVDELVLCLLVLGCSHTEINQVLCGSIERIYRKLQLVIPLMSKAMGSVKMLRFPGNVFDFTINQLDNRETVPVIFRRNVDKFHVNGAALWLKFKSWKQHVFRREDYNLHYLLANDVSVQPDAAQTKRRHVDPQSDIEDYDKLLLMSKKLFINHYLKLEYVNDLVLKSHENDMTVKFGFDGWI
ncbi:unnamed protein product [Sphenostylis stenocarpa]|uniref:Uncharacterized protein n=1 Tax=Sphenostylis stenocarpa TaxID=92480 RepID=A0AA87B7P4_9FABA|nr:unnamed protein product [Sphenostylis stenocarpa]